MQGKGGPRAHAIALRTRLLAAMLGPLLGAAAIIGIGGATLISDVVRRTNDRVLRGALGAIAETVQVERGEVTLDLPPAAFGMLENSERDNVYYRIAVGPDLLTGYADLPAPDPATLAIDQPRFRFARFRDQDIRIAEVKRMLPRIERPVIVQVAETLDNRTMLIRQLIIALLIGEVVLVGVAVLLLRPALGWSLRPLARLRRTVEARDANLRPDSRRLTPGLCPMNWSRWLPRSTICWHSWTGRPAASGASPPTPPTRCARPSPFLRCRSNWHAGVRQARLMRLQRRSNG